VWHLHGFINMLIFSFTNKQIKDHIKHYNGWLIYIIAPIVLPVYLVNFITGKIQHFTNDSEREILITSSVQEDSDIHELN